MSELYVPPVFCLLLSFSSANQCTSLRIQLQDTMALLSSGEKWRKQRREFHKFFSVTAVARWDTIQEGGVRQLLSLLLEDPQHFSEHAELYVCSSPPRM